MSSFEVLSKHYIAVFLNFVLFPLLHLHVDVAISIGRMVFVRVSIDQQWMAQISSCL